MSAAPLFIGEDMILIRLKRADVAPYAETVRQTADWRDIVPGIEDCTLRFDPENLSADKAVIAAQKALETLEAFEATSDACVPKEACLKTHNLEAEIGGKFGPDADMVTAALGLDNVEALAKWLANRDYTVALIGFQPGFAYLDDDSAEEVQEIGRLDSPRQRISAGSIGFLGGRACLYSLDGPGGWPIIGRVQARLFDPGADQPVLLSKGDKIRFLPL